MDGWIRIGTKVDDKGIDDGIKEIEKKISLTEKKKLALKAKIEVNQQELSAFSKKLNSMARKGESSPKLDKQYIRIQQQLENQKIQYQALNNQAEKYKNQVEKINMKNQEKSIKNVNSETTKVSSNLGNIIKKVSHWTFAVIGIRTAYMGIRKIMSSISQYNQQISANMQYLGYAATSIFEPLVNFVLNGLFKILSLINQISILLFGFNLFKRSGVSQFQKAMGNSAKSAKEIKNSLASFDEMNLLQENKDSGGRTIATPTFDLSSTTSQFSEILSKIFDPFIKAWETKGQTVISSIKTAFDSIKTLSSEVGSSFEKIWTNGTVQQGAETILGIFQKVFDIIGHIAEAWTNAWTRNDMGDRFIQALANGLNNLLGIIENLLILLDGFIQSSFFQFITDLTMAIATDLANAFETITGKIKEFTDFLTGKISIQELDDFSIILGSVATAILLVAAAIGVYNTVSAIASTGTKLLGLAISFLTSPIGLIIIAIGAIIAIILLLVKHWDELKEAGKIAIDFLKDKFKQFGEFLGNIASKIWNGIVDICSNIQNAIVDAIIYVKDKIVSIFNSIWNTVKSIINLMIRWYRIFS